MIKILPTGTSAVLKYGLKPARSSKARGRLGDGSKECSFELGSAELQSTWNDNRMEAVLSLSEEIFVRSVTLEFHYKSPRTAAETAVWTESYSDSFGRKRKKSVPGTFSGNSAREGAWALWLSESMDSEGLFFRQSPPSDYPILFQCRPAAKILSITWKLNRILEAGERLVLPKVGISRGPSKKLIHAWYREWKINGSRELARDRRIGWCGGSELKAPKDLREVLGVIRGRKLALDWFAVGPEYVTAPGDWLFPSDSYKDRMGSLSRTITEQNMIPGIRFAPFLVSKKSLLAAEHRDWLVKTAKGSPLTFPGYTGERESVFVLDITNPDVLAHIRRVFSVMRDQWGFRVYYLERIGESASPGLRFDNRSGPGAMLKAAATAIREILGNKVMIIATGQPLLATPGIWDSQAVTPLADLYPVSSRRKRRTLMSLTSALLHRSHWNEKGWINASPLLPSAMFNRDCGNTAGSVTTSVMLSSGLVSLTGDPRDLNDEHLDKISEFFTSFDECRKGTLTVAPNIGGGSNEPLVVRNDRGWIALFNLSERKKEVRLDRGAMKSGLGVSAPLSAGDGAVFNSPEIHVALTPRGHRLFKG